MIRFLWVVALLAVTAIVPFVSRADDATDRLRHLEDREAIRELLIAYGRTLDARDFEGFARLFARDAEYVGGGGMGAVRGPEAIAAALQRVFEANPSGISGASAHLFFNESIDLDGDTATATSMGAFVVADGDGRPVVLMLASYLDQFVREDGVWKFHRREVRSNIPAPGATPAAR
jgi:uncharacterized protein (TIGR02246 family)